MDYSDYSDYLRVVHDPNPPYSPHEAMREIEQNLIEVSRSTTCIPSEVRLNPADVLKLQSAVPVTDFPTPPPINALLGAAVIIDPGVPVGAPQWGECRFHHDGQACKLRDGEAGR